jgi:hypothetical protein
MSFFGSLFGTDQADAAQRAANDTYGKQVTAGNEIRGYGDDYAAKFKTLAAGYDPYVKTGYGANTALDRLISDPSSVRSLPGYQFDMEEGLKGLDRSAASRHMLNSGRQSKDVLRFATGLADKTYGNEFDRLSRASGAGMAATGAQIGTEGTGLSGQLATRQSAYGGAMNSAGTIGNGWVNAANAEGAGAANAVNLGLSLAKLGVGAYGGGGFGGGAPTGVDYGDGISRPMFR